MDFVAELLFSFILNLCILKSTFPITNSHTFTKNSVHPLCLPPNP